MEGNRKTNVRRQYLNLRDAISSHNRHKWTESLLRNLEMLLKQTNPSQLLVYYPFRSEIDLRPLLKSYEYSFFLPVVNPKSAMTFYPYRDGDTLKPHRFGMLEPKAEKLDPLTPDNKAVCIVPGVCFDKKGFRLGYGGGYYDRYLQKHPHITTIGICFEQSLLEQLPKNEHDLPVNYVVSELQTIRNPQ